MDLGSSLPNIEDKAIATYNGLDAFSWCCRVIIFLFFIAFYNTH